MSCASCVGRVEAALGRLPGVAEAAVNLATARARVRGMRARACSTRETQDAQVMPSTAISVRASGTA
jgi:Cu+-exporting ATPase